MKGEYRGHEIEVTRDYPIFGVDKLLFYSIFRKSDGYECASGYTTGCETVREFYGYMKQRIDNEMKDADPWGEGSDALDSGMDTSEIRGKRKGSKSGQK